MKEKVTIQQVQISKRGEIKTFQVKLPTDAKKIIGIETTVKGIDVFEEIFFDFHASPIFFFRRNYIAGEFRLQGCEGSNMFYVKDVMVNDANLGFGDFAQGFYMREKAWTHGYNRFEEEVLVDENCPVLFGTFKDRFGEIWGGDISYQVNVYVWYSTVDEA